MKVLVIYPGDSSTNDERRTFEFELRGFSADHNRILDEIWRRMNVVTGDKSREIPLQYNARSMMVGDIAVLDPGRIPHYYICDGVGWQKVSKIIAALWEKLSTRDRLMGWNYVISTALNRYVEYERKVGRL